MKKNGFCRNENSTNGSDLVGHGLDLDMHIRLVAGDTHAFEVQQ